MFFLNVQKIILQIIWVTLWLQFQLRFMSCIINCTYTYVLCNIHKMVYYAKKSPSAVAWTVDLKQVGSMDSCYWFQSLYIVYLYLLDKWPHFSGLHLSTVASESISWILTWGLPLLWPIFLKIRCFLMPCLTWQSG